jgi:hypothetical protein
LFLRWSQPARSGIPAATRIADATKVITSSAINQSFSESAVVDREATKVMRGLMFGAVGGRHTTVGNRRGRGASPALLRDYFPKGTDLSAHFPEHLLAVENELTNLPATASATGHQPNCSPRC